MRVNESSASASSKNNNFYDRSAVTADLESFKILINCMILENANGTTIDLTDFYLGTPIM